LVVALPAVAFVLLGWSEQVDNEPVIAVSRTIPGELNPPFIDNFGGAPNATPEQAAAFSWQEFIALNWPATKQSGLPNQRDTPSKACHFGDPECTGPTVWETFRGKVEIFPGAGSPPGYSPGEPSFGYDALPQYKYKHDVVACDPAQALDPVPWVNLDETDQITLDNMYAGTVPDDVSPGNSSPHLIRFLAKANRAEYVYVADNSSPTNLNDQWWSSVPVDVVTRTKAYLASKMVSPRAGSKTMVSLPYNTIEMKAGWRPLSEDEIASGHFHTQTVRFYEQGSTHSRYCYRDATWGLVALHIIQKTPSAPYFIYATFEQTDNILTTDGQPVEDADGNVLLPSTQPPTSPQECLVDPKPPPGPVDEIPSKAGSVILTSNTRTCAPLPVDLYCEDPGSRLYYHNAQGRQPVPSGGNICVNGRDNLIPGYVIDANKQAHAAISKYAQKHGIESTPWLYYKLINVQYFPYDKVITTPTPNGSLYESNPPFTAANPAPSSYYLANIVVETNRSLQLFSGGLSPEREAAVATSWNVDGTQHKNSYYGGHFYAMGGCMGCHGSQGQNRAKSAGDFSVILAVGRVLKPEIPSINTPAGLTDVPRNRSID
jgi:hypothetical protein